MTNALITLEYYSHTPTEWTLLMDSRVTAMLKNAFAPERITEKGMDELLTLRHRRVVLVGKIGPAFGNAAIVEEVGGDTYAVNYRNDNERLTTLPLIGNALQA